MENIDYRQFFLFNIRVFKICGVWKPDSNSTSHKLKNLYNGICKSVWILFLSSQFMFFCKSHNILYDLMSTCHQTIPMFVGSLMVLNIFIKIESIESMFKKLNNPMFQPKCREHFEIAKSFKKFYKTYNHSVIYLGLQTCLLFLILPHWQEDYTLPAKAWFPFQWNPSPTFEIIWAFQAISVFMITTCVACLTLFSTGLFMLIALQCDYLCITFNNLPQFHVENGILIGGNEKQMESTNPMFSNVMMENLVVCIRQYTEIRRMALEIGSIHEKGIFLLFLGGATMISTIVFLLSAEELGSPLSLMLISDTFCILVMQYVYCWSGSELTNKSANVFRASYNTPWPDCDRSFRKVLLQFMTMTQSPIEIRVGGGLIVMSVAVFTSIVKSSYSVYALLHDMVDD